MGSSCAKGFQKIQYSSAGYANLVAERRSKQKDEAALLDGLKGSSKLGTVYAIKMGDVPGVKIGFATDLAKRLAGLRTSSPLEYVVIAAFTGSVRHEKTLHTVFSRYRIQGEWFHETEPVKAFVGLMSEPDLGDKMDIALIKAGCHWRAEQSPVVAETVKQYLESRGLSF